MPCRWSSSTEEPAHLAGLREHAHLHPELLELADHEQQVGPAPSVAREDDAIDPVDVEGLRQVGRELDPPASIRVAGDGDRGHGAHQLGLHRGTEGELLAHERARGAIPDQQAALRRRRAPGNTRARALRHTEARRAAPRCPAPAASERAGDEHPLEQPDHQGGERREAEQRRDLVEGALVEKVGVAVVEAERFRGDDERDRDDEDRRAQVLIAEREGTDEQGQAHGQHVGGPKRAAKDRVAAPGHLLAGGDRVAPAPFGRRWRFERSADGTHGRERARLGRLRRHRPEAPGSSVRPRSNGLSLPPLLSCPAFARERTRQSGKPSDAVRARNSSQHPSNVLGYRPNAPRTHLRRPGVICPNSG